jgi:hypothetical protein
LSHIVTIKTQIRETAGVAAACRRLALPEPVHGTARIYSSEATGVLVGCARSWERIRTTTTPR